MSTINDASKYLAEICEEWSVRQYAVDTERPQDHYYREPSRVFEFAKKQPRNWVDYDAPSTGAQHGSNPVIEVGEHWIEVLNASWVWCGHAEITLVVTLLVTEEAAAILRPHTDALRARLIAREEERRRRSIEGAEQRERAAARCAWYEERGLAPTQSDISLARSAGTETTP